MSEFKKIKINPWDPSNPKEVGLNQCPGCGEVFKSLTGFDAHRTGEHGVDRRCMAEPEMLKAGLSKNNKGHWVTSQWSD
jgi:hypothetical protein